MKNQAFTLIELLVAILIIGILAAIAVRQYEIAVLKAKVSSMIFLGRAIKDAQERYYMFNGKYAGPLTYLDIELPSYCVVSRDGSNMWFCRDEWFLDNGMSNNKAKGSLVMVFCPESDKINYSDCSIKREGKISFYYEHPEDTSNKKFAGQIRCSAYTAKWERLFKSLPGLIK